MCSGCVTHENTYIIKNQTNKQITIYGYAVKWSAKVNLEPPYSETFDILPYSEYSVIKEFGEITQPQGIFQNADEVDSVVISFNDEKYIRYSCNYIDVNRLCNDKRNIIFNGYYDEQCSEHECTYTYTITEDDYNNAEK
jgi:hypothetical protein